jgi:cytidine deaminase
MIGLINKMITKAHNALDNAYAPYSKFKVACCIQTSNGTLFTGVNVENASYGLTLCAEAAAISNMVSAGEQHISHMVVLASSNTICPPCGACRQRIHEFSDENTMIHMCDQENVLVSSSIVELLPVAFEFNPE